MDATNKWRLAIREIAKMIAMVQEAGDAADSMESHKAVLDRIMFHANRTRLTELVLRIAQETQLIVQSGPFAGMKLVGANLSAPSLLGTYEEELHPHISRLPSRGYTMAMNVGSASGYYAVGLARLLPNCQVMAFDIDPEAQGLTALAAQINGVDQRLTVQGICTHAILNDTLAQHSKTFLLFDCEGAELELMQPEAVPAMRHCDFLVECHDFIDRSITSTLMKRFGDSHRLTVVEQGGRNINSMRLSIPMSNMERWMCLDEGRPELMRWLVGEAHRSS